VTESEEVFDFSKQVVREAAALFRTFVEADSKMVVTESPDHRETKFRVDIQLNEFMMERLEPTGLPILSEESKLPMRGDLHGRFWVVDPLDGSVNYARRSGPYGISLALMDGATPEFGIVQRLDTPAMFAGGASFPSTRDGVGIAVSRVASRDQATISTGLPARFRLDDPRQRADLLADIHGYAKVRMFGSAAVSLCMVAEGSVDTYSERGIMVWDVAAGIAIAEGAGGHVTVVGGPLDPLHVTASNGRVGPKEPQVPATFHW